MATTIFGARPCTNYTAQNPSPLFQLANEIFARPVNDHPWQKQSGVGTAALAFFCCFPRCPNGESEGIQQGREKAATPEFPSSQQVPLQPQLKAKNSKFEEYNGPGENQQPPEIPQQARGMRPCLRHTREQGSPTGQGKNPTPEISK